MGGKIYQDETKTTERSIDVVRTDERLRIRGSSSSQASESEAARSTLRFILRFLCRCSIRERERERYYGMDASGWLGGNGKGTFLGGNTLAVMAHLATWDNSTAHTQHTTHTANGVIGMWEFCFVSWGFGLGLVCFVVLGRSRVCLVRLGFAAFLDFVRVCWAGSLAAFTWPGFRMVVVTGDCSGESDNNCLALFIE